MSKIDDKFIINLKGKDFVTYEGLLDLAHQKGLKGMKTELIQIPSKDNNNTCIVHARAITENGEFHGIGDANPSNVNGFIAQHLIRMAETRAKARALRDLTNIGMTAIEELGDEEGGKSTNTPNNNRSPSTTQTNKPKTDNLLASNAQINYIDKLVEKKGYGLDSMINYIKTAYQKNNIKALSKQEASEVINMLNDIK